MNINCLPSLAPARAKLFEPSGKRELDVRDAVRGISTLAWGIATTFYLIKR